MEDNGNTTYNSANNGAIRFGSNDKLCKSTNKKSAISKSGNLAKSRKLSDKSGTTEKSKFLTFDAKNTFNYLKLAFTEIPILQYLI